MSEPSSTVTGTATALAILFWLAGPATWSAATLVFLISRQGTREGTEDHETAPVPEAAAGEPEPAKPTGLPLLGSDPAREEVAPSAPEVDRAAMRRSMIEEAVRIGDRLGEIAEWEGEDVAWVALEFREQRWFLAPVSIDLYVGLPGIALFLGYLARIERDMDLPDSDRREALSRSAARTLRRVIQGSDQESIGAFSGWGGVLYACTHLAALGQDVELRAVCDRSVQRIDELADRAIGRQLTCIFVDNGVLRLDEIQSFQRAATRHGISWNDTDPTARFDNFEVRMMRSDTHGHIAHQCIEPKWGELKLQGTALQARRLKNVLDKLRETVGLLIDNGQKLTLCTLIPARILPQETGAIAFDEPQGRSQFMRNRADEVLLQLHLASQFMQFTIGFLPGASLK